MDCYVSYRSPWMRKKVLDYLQNLLMRHQERISDDDIFIPMECSAVENRLSELICKLPRHLIPETGLDRANITGLKQLPDCIRKRIREQMYESSLRCTLGGLWNKKALQSTVRNLIPELVDAAKASIIPEEDDVFQARIHELQKTLKLSDREIDILLVSLAVNGNLRTDPRGGGSYRGGRGGQSLFMMTNCLNTTESDILKSVGANNTLRRYNCLDDDLDITSEICSFLSGMSDEPLVNSFFKKDTEAVLPWSDFATLTKKHGTILKRILTSSHPMNILLYGAPGTGKTSFARALASEVGKTCFRISQNTCARGNETSSSPAFRFAALQFCDAQVEPQNSLIVVDEADEMLRGQTMRTVNFGDGESTTGDKGLLNTVLDTMKTSTIWITNTPAEALDESSRRRFAYSIRFEPLNSEQRKQIWKNSIARLKMGRLFTAAMLDRFSNIYPVSAGGIAQTLENIGKLNPRKKEIPELVEQLMKPHCELLKIKLANDKLLPSKDYSLEGLNIKGDVQLDRIVEAIRMFQLQKDGQAPDRPRMNLLLSGPPGTGKTEFVKHLGAVLNTKINVKMGSDLLSMWVGETEQNIKRAFAEAEAEHAILFLDEIDGLVQSRTNARNRWEVTQVNELLYQMEIFNGVMIGATNFIQNLDQAIMRRFTFKLEFNFLDAAGKKLFFERMFHSTLTEEESIRLADIPSLAPGDFRTVRQSLYYYGGEVTNAMRLDALERESEAKGISAFRERSKIGF